jgi:hypothetical protein
VEVSWGFLARKPYITELRYYEIIKVIKINEMIADTKWIS